MSSTECAGSAEASCGVVNPSNISCWKTSLMRRVDWVVEPPTGAS
ncbi:hypothetical protein [Streptomyces sp. NPDC002324]